MKTIYKINGKVVKQTEFKAFEKLLHGKENWYCEKTSGGGTTGWLSQDANGTRFKVTIKKSKESALSTIEQESPGQ